MQWGCAWWISGVVSLDAEPALAGVVDARRLAVAEVLEVRLQVRDRLGRARRALGQPLLDRRRAALGRRLGGRCLRWFLVALVAAAAAKAHADVREHRVVLVHLRAQ